ncbi:MAG: signal peptidase II [Cellulosilyticum sp.]|nr:signal peptidase II [Cellulosilyticum sp.]
MNFIVVISMALLILIDQMTKVWAVNTLANGMDIRIWEGVFHLHYISNYGAAWGMLSGKQTFLIMFTSIIIIGMIYYMTKLPHNKEGFWTKVALVMIMSGAIGNLIDRVTLGYVRDFLYFILIDFPIFNIADILVVVGVGVLMLAMFLGDAEGNKEVQK